VDHFSKVFDIDYMLPKCDLLAVHEFSHGAMENWGLITYVFPFPSSLSVFGWGTVELML